MITIVPTPQIVTLDGVQCRHWLGTTAQGHSVDVLVHRIGAATAEAQAELERALREMPAPQSITGPLPGSDQALLCYAAIEALIAIGSRLAAPAQSPEPLHVTQREWHATLTLLRRLQQGELE